jgi:hypothetical protein
MPNVFFAFPEDIYPSFKFVTKNPSGTTGLQVLSPSALNYPDTLELPKLIKKNPNFKENL